MQQFTLIVFFFFFGICAQLHLCNKPADASNAQTAANKIFYYVKISQSGTIVSLFVHWCIFQAAASTQF